MTHESRAHGQWPSHASEFPIPRGAPAARQPRCRAKGVAVSEFPLISWTEAGQTHTARWRSESDAPPPKKVMIADDTLSADKAYKLVCEGTALLWRGDYHNARQLLSALARRAGRKPRKPASSPTEAFNFHRQTQAQRARLLGMLLLPFNADYSIPLRRAPDVRQACEEAYGPAGVAFVASLRELQGLVGSHEWRKKGVEITALGGEHIHPHYGVYSPIRGEYLDLVAEAPLPSTTLAFDIGTGTGVLAAVLARRGVERVIGTDQDPRALACARENLDRLGLSGKVDVVEADLFPEGRAPLIVCNPPWLPAKPTSPIENAVYDPDSRMLKGFLDGLAAHLEPGGEGWLILSDLAEHLGLRSRDALLALFDAAGLKVVDRLDIRPRHPKAGDASDPLHQARAAEVTSLWRLAAR
ncbi:class I SAM-dependent methyltransferase [Crenobacter cavernae]|uniref:Class I SAM-dependent methyltransferase n=1 Tax=Crenobacter cavernae TaxID=2290923 RepID=A0A345Y4K6_9NEIS|nr:class I SAM-dependent methyltransferase [Crenobacter cavernae]